jgi:short subunit dehydrogenase-like uncharacterized protein
MADELSFAYRVFDLNDSKSLTEALRQVRVVVNAAGPFSETSRQMIDACLQTGTHYLDINGDISVFEQIHSRDAEARSKGIMLLPGVGFDVLPTDCMALHLKNRLPGAKWLRLAFASLGGGLSHGTAMTVVNKLGEGGAARVDGMIVKKPLGEKGMWVDFGARKLFVMSIPWGDVFTAYITTGIPNIESYTAIKPFVYKILKVQGLFNGLLRTRTVRNMLRSWIRRRPAGPGDNQRNKASSLVWGEAGDASGQTVSASFTCSDGYTLTAHGSLVIAKKVLGGDFKTGYQTPASCYGEHLMQDLPGTNWDILS